MRYTVERVWYGELGAYLNGRALYRDLWHDFGRMIGHGDEQFARGREHYAKRFFSRPLPCAELVAIHQEDVSDGGGYVNEKSHHEEYVVIWEHQ